MTLLAAALAAHLSMPDPATFACTLATIDGKAKTIAEACTDDDRSTDDTPPPGTVLIAKAG